MANELTKYTSRINISKLNDLDTEFWIKAKKKKELWNHMYIERTARDCPFECGRRSQKPRYR